MSHPLPEPTWINILPPEILSSIFILLRQIRRYQQLLPLQVNLSHVCKYWRQIAISTPQLWSTITLFSAASQPCVIEWLARSGSAAPLDVRLDLFDADFCGQIHEQWLDDNLAHIVPNIPRFRSLFLFTSQECSARYVLGLFNGAKAPLLERLSIHVGREFVLHELLSSASPSNNSIFPTVFDGGSPRLYFAELHSLARIPPLTKITILHLNFMARRPELPLNDLVNVLRMSRNLFTLSLRGNVKINGGWKTHRDQPFVTFPELRNLELSTKGRTSVYFILCFAAPRLESLRWHVERDECLNIFRLPSLYRSPIRFPKLKYLTLVAQQLTPHHFLSLTQVFPVPSHILYSHPSLSESPALLDSLFRAHGLKVLAFRGLTSSENEKISQELRNALGGKSTVVKILGDAELLSYLKSDVGALGDLVELDEINSHTFPDYWLTSRIADYPDRL